MLFKAAAFFVPRLRHLGALEDWLKRATLRANNEQRGVVRPGFDAMWYLTNSDYICPLAELPVNGLTNPANTLHLYINTMELNSHNKAEYPPMHTAEHLLNQTMVRMFGCERSRNAHIERKKSKISFDLPAEPTTAQVDAIVAKMNELIAEDLPVTYEFVTADNVPEGVKLDRLPDNASETLRIVRIGQYDVCPCIGAHVASTAELHEFILLGTNWDPERHSFRLRFKLGVASNKD